MAKKTQRKKDDDEKSPLYLSPEYIGYSKTHFGDDLWGLVFDAWVNRASERSLYALLDHIGVNVCNTIRHPKYPQVTIALNPQGLLGPRTTPAGEAAPLRDPKDTLYPEQYPDFIRAFLSRARNGPRERWASIREIVDIWELKDHNVAELWGTPEAHKKASIAMTSFKNMDQVYNQAMAAFAHNSTWKKIYLMLIVGVYFSQFVFTRPLGEIKRPLSPIDATTKLTAEQTLAAVERIRARIAEYEARTMPTVEYFNQPVIVFDSGPEALMQSQQDVSLSPQFLYALRLPLKEYEGCRFQKSWFSPKTDKPEPVPQSGPVLDPGQWVRQVLIESEVAKLEVALADWTTSPASTANESAMSAGFQPTRHLQKQVQQMSPLGQREARRTGRAPANPPPLVHVPMIGPPIHVPMLGLGVNAAEDDEDEEEGEELQEEVQDNPEESGGEEGVLGDELDPVDDPQVIDAADQVYVNPHDDLEYV